MCWIWNLENARAEQNQSEGRKLLQFLEFFQLYSWKGIVRNGQKAVSLNFFKCEFCLDSFLSETKIENKLSHTQNKGTDPQLEWTGITKWVTPTHRRDLSLLTSSCRSCCARTRASASGFRWQQCWIHVAWKRRRAASRAAERTPRLWGLWDCTLPKPGADSRCMSQWTLHQESSPYQHGPGIIDLLWRNAGKTSRNHYM